MPAAEAASSARFSYVSAAARFFSCDLMNQSSASASLDRRSFWLGVSLVLFGVLFAAHAVRPDLTTPAAMAGETVDARDYQLVSSLQPDGNDAVYILDKRSGLLALLMWNNQAGRPEVVDIKPLQSAFGG